MFPECSTVSHMKEHDSHQRGLGERPGATLSSEGGYCGCQSPEGVWGCVAVEAGLSSWSQWLGSPGSEGRAGSGPAPALAVTQGLQVPSCSGPYLSCPPGRANEP